MKSKFNMLHIIFNLIVPERKVTWLSSSFSRWRHERRRRYAINYKNHDHKSVYFDVPGAGDVRISESCHYQTGKVVGFGFGVEWCEHPFIGGVIGRDEAKRMAEFILEKCSEVSETMDEEIIRKDKEFDERFKH